MRAILVVRRREYLARDVFSEVVIWTSPRTLPGSPHNLKYRLALVDADICMLCYDNEAGKGDHRHSQGKERPYRVTTIEALLDDFDADVTRYLNERDGHTGNR